MRIAVSLLNTYIDAALKYVRKNRTQELWDIGCNSNHCFHDIAGRLQMTGAQAYTIDVVHSTANSFFTFTKCINSCMKQCRNKGHKAICTTGIITVLNQEI